MWAAVCLVALAALSVHGAHRLALTWTAWRRRHAEPAPRPLDVCPHVTVQLPLYNEAAVAARLLDAAAALDWPRDRLELQILDDSTDETTRVCADAAERLRARGLDVTHLRRTDRRGFKAGALEAGRAVARGELLLVLDADFVPPPDLLRRIAGDLAAPDVAMVQVRWEHLNAAASPLTRAEALLLDGHFAVEQPARAWTGRIFNFNGTAGLWRAAAIADAGGWHADTLTEDLDLSYRAALRGWRFVYRRDLVAPAELPATMRAFKGQQFRWAKGSIECGKKLAPALIRTRVPWRVRAEAALHLTQNLAYLPLVALLLAAPLAATAPGPAWLTPLSAAFTALVMGSYALVAARGAGRSLAATLVRVPLLTALTAGIALNQARAVLEGAVGRRSPFVRTPKDGSVGRTRVRSRYRVGPGGVWVLEAALAVHLAVGAVTAPSPLTAALLALFAAGCAWVAIATALDR